MDYELMKTFGFNAAHFLPGVPADHKCRRMHGHNYRIDVHVGGQPDGTTGLVVDYGDIKRVVEPILDELDHRTLNDVPGLENPTSEMLCGWLWQRLSPRLPLLAAITVHETCEARCTYRGT